MGVGIRLNSEVYKTQREMEEKNGRRKKVRRGRRRETVGGKNNIRERESEYETEDGKNRSEKTIAYERMGEEVDTCHVRKFSNS